MSDRKPLLYIGVDIGWRHDTSAIAALYRHNEWDKFVLYDHRIYPAPVRIQDVTDALLRLIGHDAVAGIYYDETQYVSEAQRIAERGYERLLHKVNQGPLMVEVGNILKQHLQRGDLIMYKDTALRGQFSWCNARETEAGLRITKMNQSKPVDGVIALGMALHGAVNDLSHLLHPSIDSPDHEISLMELP
jgi:phage terminase large subunit-like protein